MSDLWVTVEIRGIGNQDWVPGPNCYVPTGETFMSAIGGGFCSFAVGQLVSAYCPEKLRRYVWTANPDEFSYWLHSTISFVAGAVMGFSVDYGRQFSDCRRTLDLNEKFRRVVASTGEKPLSCNARELICWERTNGTETIDRFLSLHGSSAKEINQILELC